MTAAALGWADRAAADSEAAALKQNPSDSGATLMDLSIT